MAEVFELEKIETERQHELPKPEKDTWILKLPAEICLYEGLAEGTLVSLTIKNAGIQTSFIRPPSERLQTIAKQLIDHDRQLHKELNKIGD